MDRPASGGERAGADGVFLAFEGVEGSGKTTQAARLADRLEAAAIARTLAREPGGTPAGERVRELILDPGLELGAEAELLLLLAARAEFVRERVRPALERGEVVVADRYELSTFAYQGVARGLGLERVRRLNEFATGGLAPDLTVVLTVDPKEARNRREGEVPDRMEAEGGSFHRAVAEAYERLAASEPGAVAVDGVGPPEEVERRVHALLRDRFPGRFPPETFPKGEGL